MKMHYNYRSLGIRQLKDGAPASIDAETRSVEVIAATENPVAIFDYDRYEIIDEVLLMSGLEMPPSRQVPLLDTHSRYDTSSVIGSCRDLKVVGSELVGRSFFSSAPEAAGPWTKTEEGHLTDYSVGYRVDEATYVSEGETAVIGGRSFTGPVKVVTRWKIRELSVCPIGADEHAKARAAHTQEAPKTQEPNMDPKLRAFLERMGLSKEATEAEAERFYQDFKAPETKTEPAPNVDTAAVTRAERERITEINAMGRKFDCEDITEALIASGASVAEARAQVMDHLAKQKEKENMPSARATAQVGAEDRDKFRAAAQDALMVRGGMVVANAAPGHDELTGRTMVELARMSLARAGQRDSGRPIEMVGRALTTSDFPLILANIANKALAEGFESADETWSMWCAEGSVSDFKTHTMVRAGEVSDLDEVPENTEYKYGTRDESKESYQIATFGKLFAITRQTIINDDLNALTDVPAQHGETAGRKVGDIVYAVLTANSAMGDGVALFHSTHSNVMTSGVPSVTTLAEGIKKMGLQKDIGGKRRLNIRPEFFLAPKAIEGAAEVLFKSEYWDASNKGATTVNPYSGNYFTRVYEPRLDDNSATAWYLLTRKGKTVKVFFLDGQKMPYMESRQGWSVDGIEYKVRLDAGAKAMDWRGMQYNAGS